MFALDDIEYQSLHKGGQSDIGISSRYKITWSQWKLIKDQTQLNGNWGPSL